MTHTKFLEAMVLVTLFCVVGATTAYGEDVDFFCNSATAAEASVDPEIRKQLIETTTCGYFTQRYGFMSKGTLTHVKDVDGTDKSVYFVDYGNGTYTYTVK